MPITGTFFVPIDSCMPRFATPLVVFVVSSCATFAPVLPRVTEHELILDRPEAWSRLVEIVAVRGLPIAVMETDSYMLTTEWTQQLSSIGVSANAFDCDASFLYVGGPPEWRMNAVIRDFRPGTSRMMLRVEGRHFQRNTISGSLSGPFACQSGGSVEQWIVSQINDPELIMATPLEMMGDRFAASIIVVVGRAEADRIRNRDPDQLRAMSIRAQTEGALEYRRQGGGGGVLAYVSVTGEVTFP